MNLKTLLACLAFLLFAPVSEAAWAFWSKTRLSMDRRRDGPPEK